MEPGPGCTLMSADLQPDSASPPTLKTPPLPLCDSSDCPAAGWQDSDMLQRRTDGTVYSMLDCPTCDKSGPHAHWEGKGEFVFQCAQCFMGFTDGPPQNPAR
jgi:hypothetical protein